MGSAHKSTLLLSLLLLLGLVFASFGVSSTKNDHEHCERVVKKWKSSAYDVDADADEDKHILKDLLFFLHVPRTGGRTYFYCFLKKLYPADSECPRSYDKLRFNPSKTSCRLLATHDDYSMMTKLPRERTSVVTILRNPIDRVFSTYEFSLEVAARFLVHPNLTSATQMAAKLRAKTKGISTLDIWPWKYLVPWMREDLFARRDARHRMKQNNFKKEDSYDMKDVAMPLHAYINDPVARDIIHNGATFQVAGLTNNSYSVESHDVRHCVQKYQDLGSHVLEVAKRRLNDMLYVGLTEEHRESATMFANVVGSQVISQMIASSSDPELGTNNTSETTSAFLDLEPKSSDDMNSSTGHEASKSDEEDNPSASNRNMTVADLMEAYEGCISNLRKSQSGRRTTSLKKISSANFSKEARREVSDIVLQQIKELNRLDLELYKHAQDIFAKQRGHVKMKSTGTMEKPENLLNKNSLDVSIWTIPLVAILSIVISLILFLFVNARRRALKLKIKR